MVNAFIFDIDGTLALCDHRLHYIEPKKELFTCKVEDLDKHAPDWDAFYAACDKDEVIRDTARVLNALALAGYQILFVTGRPESNRAKTEKWILEMLNVPAQQYELHMRRDGDHRQDYQVKLDIYGEKIQHRYRIRGVFEDRTQCVKMWRNLNLTCYQVADGNY